MTTTGNRKKRLVFTRHFPDDVELRAGELFDSLLNRDDHEMSRDEICRLAEGADALFICSGDKFDRALIEKLPPEVKMIATFSVGYEHIDLAACRDRGIVASNTPDVLTNATADIAMLLILGAARGASWGERMVREKRWHSTTLTWPLGFDVSEQRLGILGMGRIGQALAKRARAFDMELHYHNRKPVPAEESHGAVYHPVLDDMLPHCDFLSINCASTPETRGMVNASLISKLPKGAIVVNSSRGDIVDDEALIAALKSGHLAAAGLDVFKGEPNIHPAYRELDNVFLLPHLGSATFKTRSAMGMRALENLVDFFSGRRPRDQIT